MDATAAAAPLTWKERLSHPKTFLAVAAGMAVGALGVAGGWQFYLKPLRRVADLRYETMQDVSTLFGLQLHYKKVRGVYAPDLETLLSLSPDREDFKARMREHLDLNTIAVVGDAEKFKVEANVLDAERTLIRIKGPIETREPTPESALPLNESTTAAGPDGGAPVLPP